jgi:prepilin-type processing-associated H-X9-DG protein/prepilin-type N-terminal cleavage/methylation domain-containing protein
MNTSNRALSNRSLHKKGFTPLELPVVSGRKRAAFTLVELLVVIGIIALLIAILLPTLNRARQQSRTVACLSNLRSLGQAIMMYQADTRWMIPACYWGPYAGGCPAGSLVPATVSMWSNILVDGNYLHYPQETFKNPRNVSMGLVDGPIITTPFFCPEGNMDVLSNGSLNLSPTSPTDQLASCAFRTQSMVPPYRCVDTWYGINAAEQESAVPGNAGVLELPGRSWPYYSGDFASLPGVVSYDLLRPTTIRKSSEVVLLFDGLFMNASIGQAAATGTNGAFRIAARHNNKRYTNLLFCDGHATSELRTNLPIDSGGFTIAALSQRPYTTVKWRIDQ